MGIREQKKIKIRESILKYARDSFLKNGYAETTLESVAEKAEIGVGTLYNYFTSKADIFLAIMTEELAFSKDDSIEDKAGLEAINDDPVALVLEQIWKMEKSLTTISKETWKELVGAALATMKNENDLLDKLMHLDSHFILKMQRLFDSLKEQGLLSEELSSAQGAFAVYSIAVTQFMLYIYSDLTVKDIKSNIENQIAFVFTDKKSKCR